MGVSSSCERRHKASQTAMATSPISDLALLQAAPFLPVEDLLQYIRAARCFLEAGSSMSLPVWQYLDRQSFLMLPCSLLRRTTCRALPNVGRDRLHRAVVWACVVRGPCLKAAALKSINQLDPADLQVILTECSSLSHLSISLHAGTAAESWESAWAAQSSQRLTHLHVELCIMGSEDAVRMRSVLGALPTSLVALQVNYVKSLRFDIEFAAKLVPRCKQLREIAVTRFGRACQGVSVQDVDIDAALRNLAAELRRRAPGPPLCFSMCGSGRPPPAIRATCGVCGCNLYKRLTTFALIPPQQRHMACELHCMDLPDPGSVRPAVFRSETEPRWEGSPAKRLTCMAGCHEEESIYLVDAGSGNIRAPWGVAIACGGSSRTLSLPLAHLDVAPAEEDSNTGCDFDGGVCTERVNAILGSMSLCDLQASA